MKPVTRFTWGGGTLGEFLCLDIAGQIRVRVMETLYRLELRRHNYPAVSSDRRKSNGSADWLCLWLASEQLCVNVSRKVGNWGTGEVHARLFHSSRLLNATGNHRSTRLMHNGSLLRLSVRLSWLQAFPPTTA